MSPKILFLSIPAVSLFLLSLLAPATPTGQKQEKAELAKKAFSILKTKCFSCHGQNGVANKNVFVLDHARMLKDKTIIPGDASCSLIKQVESGAMPLGGDKLPASEIDALKKWVEANAPDWADEQPKPKQRIFLTETELAQLIEADLQRVEVRSRTYMRYYSIAHLYNADVPEEELEGYRIGLAKLLNSLSWHPEISRPKAIDPAKTLLRIDLRDFDWTPETWKTILSAYPYSVRTGALQRITALSGATLPYIRADWFVANASLPPLYHEILDLPLTVGELEKRLGVDTARNFEQEKNIARGGMRKSGVSNNNRVVERHVSPYGAYWKSYDFNGNVGEQNIFKDPLKFKEAGGEMIFNLPNGMQAYFLAKANGQRLDVAPITIVGDRNYPDDPEVHNGRSCMSCHNEGMKNFKDDVRPIVEKQENTSFDRDKALALYLPQSEVDSLLKKDRERFRLAVAITGGALSPDFRTEPINALSRKFRSELSVAQAAAEAGLDVKTFQSKVAKSRRLSDLGFGQLLVENGGIKRDAWDDYFGDMAEELGLGQYHKPSLIVNVKPPSGGGNGAQATGNGKTLIITLAPGVTMTLAKIPAGDFQMGDSDQTDNQPKKVFLDEFYMQTTDVTVLQYRAYCKEKGIEMPPAPSWGLIDSHPVVNVSFTDAQGFCAWLSEKSGKKIRLPKEEEWEKAARGVNGKKYPWGDDFDASKLWSSAGSVESRTNPVRQFPADEYGLFDMAGNVWQWCDSLNDGDQTRRVVRGGSWGCISLVCFRASFRSGGYLTDRDRYGGFRCASGPQ